MGVVHGNALSGAAPARELCGGPRIGDLFWGYEQVDIEQVEQAVARLAEEHKVAAAVDPGEIDSGVTAADEIVVGSDDQRGVASGLQYAVVRDGVGAEQQGTAALKGHGPRKLLVLPQVVCHRRRRVQLGKGAGRVVGMAVPEEIGKDKPNDQPVTKRPSLRPDSAPG